MATAGLMCCACMWIVSPADQLWAATLVLPLQLHPQNDALLMSARGWPLVAGIDGRGDGDSDGADGFEKQMWNLPIDHSRRVSDYSEV
jgi:hypothetical protein